MATFILIFLGLNIFGACFAAKEFYQDTKSNESLFSRFIYWILE